MSTKELPDIRVFRLAQSFVRAAKDYLALAQHQNFGVDQTQPLALALEDDLALIVDDGVFRAEIIQIVHLVRDEDRGDILQIAQLHGKLADGARRRRIE